MNTEKYNTALASSGEKEMPMKLSLCLIALLSLLPGCTGPTLAPAVHRPDGGWHVTCGASLDACVNRATKFCKERGFVVISGMSKRSIYGAELGVSQIAVREAELDFACADRRGDLPTVLPACAPSTPVAPAAPAIPAP
jgi:hypothetical protein